MKSLVLFTFLLFMTTLSFAQNNATPKDSVATTHRAPSLNRPLYFVDKVQITEEELQKINPDHIQSVEVLKGQNAVDHVNESARNGVVIITMKKEFPFRKAEDKN